METVGTWEVEPAAHGHPAGRGLAGPGAHSEQYMTGTSPLHCPSLPALLHIFTESLPCGDEGIDKSPADKRGAHFSCCDVGD